MALLTLNDKPIVLKGSGGGEMVSFEIKSRGPTFGAPMLWYCDGEGVKQAESFGTVQCLKNSAVVTIGAASSFSGMNEITDFRSEVGSAHLYQIIDNASFQFLG